MALLLVLVGSWVLSIAGLSWPGAPEEKTAAGPEVDSIKGTLVKVENSASTLVVLTIRTDDGREVVYTAAGPGAQWPAREFPAWFPDEIGKHVTVEVYREAPSMVYAIRVVEGSRSP